jgi:hypothetical protein
MKYLITLLRVFAAAFQTIVTKLPDNKEDCPPVMHSRHSKDAHEMLAKHLKAAQVLKSADWKINEEKVQRESDLAMLRLARDQRSPSTPELNDTANRLREQLTPGEWEASLSTKVCRGPHMGCCPYVCSPDSCPWGCKPAAEREV